MFYVVNLTRGPSKSAIRIDANNMLEAIRKAELDMPDWEVTDAHRCEDGGVPQEIFKQTC